MIFLCKVADEDTEEDHVKRLRAPHLFSQLEFYDMNGSLSVCMVGSFVVFSHLESSRKLEYALYGYV